MITKNAAAATASNMHSIGGQPTDRQQILGSCSKAKTNYNWQAIRGELHWVYSSEWLKTTVQIQKKKRKKLIKQYNPRSWRKKKQRNAAATFAAIAAAMKRQQFAAVASN